MKNRNLIISLPGATILTALFFTILHLGFPGIIYPESIYGFFFKRGPVQFVSMWLFFFGLVSAIYSFYQLQIERKGLRHLVEYFRFNNRLSFPADVNTVISHLSTIYIKCRTQARFINLLYYFTQFGSKAKEKAREWSQREIAEQERNLATLHLIPKILPMLGFLGTVLGLAAGLSMFLNNENLTPQETVNWLKKFSQSLAVAFDTTILALIASLILTVIINWLEKSWESFSTALDIFVDDTLISKLPIEDKTQGWEKSAVKDAIMSMTKELKNLLVENAEDTSRKISETVAGSINSVMEQLQMQINEGFSVMAECISEETKEIAAQLGREYSKLICEGMKEGFNTLDNYNGKMTRTIVDCVTNGFTQIEKSLLRPKRYLICETPENEEKKEVANNA